MCGNADDDVKNLLGGVRRLADTRRYMEEETRYKVEDRDLLSPNLTGVSAVTSGEARRRLNERT